MPIKTRKYTEIVEDTITSISLSLANSKDIKEWSHGEVVSPETINYKSYKPEKGGLFDEVIFGPTTDFKCPICSTKYKRSNVGQICEKTDECKNVQPEILPSSSRRSRMGHIELASPIVHFWFFKIDNSILAKLLGLKPENSKKAHTRVALENIIYFKSHIVLESGGLKSLPKNEIIDINIAPVIYRNALVEIRENYSEGTEAYEDITFAVEELEETATSKIGKDYGVDFYELNEIIEEYSDAKIGTGALAIEYLLENFDIKAEVRRVKTAITKINKEFGKSTTFSDGKKNDRKKLYKRLEVLNSFIESKQNLGSILIESLPVLPADLRPLIQIDGGRHSTTDVNELYRRIIIRNNRLKKWNELDAPILIKQNELRMLQEAVDALIDNTRKKPSPVLSKDNRPLKSISDSLSGKKGRFRQNLLGKRVDYSGRSVIVVGPNLKMHQVGIPRQMAAKLFEPWIIFKLIKADAAPSIKVAKKMIEEQNNTIWPFVEEAIKGKIVLLNRAPTLHRLSIQAFEPVLVRGKAIKLHALVTTAFNADFDGDQMAVHVPISDEAIREARELMLANKNILGPKDGEPIINPSQDMILGLFYLTKEKSGAKGEGNVYGTYEELFKAYDLGKISLHARVALPVTQLNKEISDDKGYAISTVGKFIFNRSFPKNFPFVYDNSEAALKSGYKKNIVKPGTNIREFISQMPINAAFDKKDIAKVARKVFDQYNASIAKEDLSLIVKKLTPKNASDTVMQFAELTDYKGDKLSKTHAVILSQLVSEHFKRLNKILTIANEGVERIFEVDDKVKLLEDIWFNYTNIVANTLDNIKELGFHYSMISGTTMSIDDIKQSKIKDSLVNEGNKYISDLQIMFKKGLVTDDEKYQLTIKKWTNVKDTVQDDLKKLTEENPDNPIFTMMKSGARGNISNFVQLAGLRGLMANNKKTTKATAETATLVRSTIDVPVKSSFLEGLTAYEFYSSTHGARKGLTDTALNTAEAGYLTRRLVDAAQNIVVKEDDCKTEQGTNVIDIIDTKTGTVIVPLQERIEGRFLLLPVKTHKGEFIANRGEFITPELAEKIISAKIKTVTIRSVFGCQTNDGVCKICYGKDLATNRIVAIGEAVGIVAAQSIGEPGTQLTMRTFHTGGVAGVSDITGGFARLKQLIDATNPWGKNAIISNTHGTILSVSTKEKLDEVIDGQDIKYIAEKGTKLKDAISGTKTVIIVQANNEDKTVYGYWFNGVNRQIRVKKGSIVKPGHKLVDGPIDLRNLLEVAGITSVQKYLLKEIQRLYRLQGISISDKYIEIIVRQMLSKVIIQDPGDSKFYAGAMIDLITYKNENSKILLRGKKPAYGMVEIIGVKQLPLLSKSFLAAASYQETAKVLVKASIRGKLDNLSGFKENIIVGHKIPAGTNFKFDNKSKYDIRDPRSYFVKKSEM
ncbi:MAG: DNA-directed RNA polymerase subunit beta' [Mycoplasmatales bacterium]|nr:DNA-directed RNA polymerase subunit beta' [Mycoplasmatales bacterium]